MSTRRKRAHRAWNAYCEDDIETIETAISVAMERHDFSNKGEALSYVANAFLLESGGGRSAETVENGIYAAMREEGLEDRGEALAEMARAYTGWSAEPPYHEQ